MDRSASRGPGFAQLTVIGALLVVALALAAGHFFAGDIGPAGVFTARDAAQAPVVWLADSASLIGDHPRQRHDARARSAPDPPDRSLIVPALVLIAALSLCAVGSAGWARPGVGRPGPPGRSHPMLRPG
jgi:hypothetical protein